MECNWKGFYKSLVRKKYIPDENLNVTLLERCLTTFDLTFLGVGSTLGLGIYILVGQIASTTAGPAVCISYFIAAVASVFAALCYAEFGARVPKAGSAYVYSYVTVGEFMAFIIGWNLVLEYVIGTASVARGYSGYLDSIFNNTIARHLNETLPIHIHSLSSYPDFLAFGITIVLTVLLAIGVKESTSFNNVCTILNLMVVCYAVITGSFQADTHNWNLKPEEIPADTGDGGFFPFGFKGVMTAAATCFYGYVGFDCIATTGEEAKNPQKSIPIAIVTSLFIVFLAYFSVSVVQTLMVPYYFQNVPAPLPYVFDYVGWPVAKWIITIGPLIGLSTSLLGAMFPLPRLMYAMANDGLIFRFLANTNQKFKTPLIATFIAGVFSGFMAMMFDITELVKLMSIGTLLAYTSVAVSVLIVRYEIQEEHIPLAPSLTNGRPSSQSRFIDKSNMLDSSVDEAPAPGEKFLICAFVREEVNFMTASTNTTLASTASTQHYSYKELFTQIFNLDRIEVQTMLSSKVSMLLIISISLILVVLNLLLNVLEDDLFAIDPGAFFACGTLFVIVIILVVALEMQPSDQQRLSFRVPWVPVVPVLSVFVNFYLMLKLPTDTWYRFLYWMIAGFVIYFGYGIWNSSERVSPNPQLSRVIEQSHAELESDSSTEISPLLQ